MFQVLHNHDLLWEKKWVWLGKTVWKCYPATPTTTTTPTPSRSGYPSWILKRGGLESSGRIVSSWYWKTKRKVFFFLSFFGKTKKNKKKINKMKIDFLRFFEIFGFLDHFWHFFVFGLFYGFFFGGGIPFKVTKVTTKRYQGYYWTPKICQKWAKTA